LRQIFKEMKTKIQLVGVALFIMGIAFVFNAFTTYLKNQGTFSKFEKTNATVVAIGKTADSTAYPVLQFKTIDNQRIRIRSMEEKLANLAQGDTISLYYDLINPESIFIPTGRENVTFIVLGGFGSLMCLPAIFFLIVQIRNSQKIKQLKVGGKKIKTTITQIEPINKRKIFGITPYIIHCEGSVGMNNGKLQKFKSNLIWANPQEYLSDNQLDVYIDLVNSDKYCLDLSVLPTEVLRF
jgi:TRAP-type uncharacterized transport system fused permease subunit